MFTDKLETLLTWILFIIYYLFILNGILNLPTWFGFNRWKYAASKQIGHQNAYELHKQWKNIQLYVAVVVFFSCF